MPTWPTQAECDSFYGDPRGPNGGPSQKWIRENLVRVTTPFRMTFDGKPVSGIQIHKKCAESLARVFAGIWVASGHNQAVIEQWGVDKFGGSFNYRLMRGLDPKRVRLVQKNNGNDGVFWTKSDSPVLPSHDA